jgi:hypothetical protein
MIESVFSELKSNGYSDAQILALCEGLRAKAHTPGGDPLALFPDRGGLAELEALCSAGLPHQM